MFGEAMFSINIKVVNAEMVPPIVSATGVCDRCREEFEVMSPSDAGKLLDMLAHHMLHRCQGGASK